MHHPGDFLLGETAGFQLLLKVHLQMIQEALCVSGGHPVPAAMGMLAMEHVLLGIQGIVALQNLIHAFAGKLLHHRLRVGTEQPLKFHQLLHLSVGAGGFRGDAAHQGIGRVNFRILQSKRDGTADGALPQQNSRVQLLQLIVQGAVVLGEVEGDAFASEGLIQQHQPFCRRQVNASDAPGVYDHGAGIFSNGGLDVRLEPVNIGEEQVAAEPVDHRILKGQRVPVPLQGIEVRLPGDHAHAGSGRRYRRNGHLEERQHNADHDPVDRTENQHSQECNQKDKQLVPAGFPQLFGHGKVQNAPERRHHNAGQNGHRQVPEQGRAHQQHQKHGGKGGKAHKLRTAPKGIGNPAPGHAAVDGAAAGESTGQVHGAVGQQLSIALQLVAVFHGIAAGGQQSLGHDHGGDAQGFHNQILPVNPQVRKARKHELRQSRGHGGQHFDPIPIQMKHRLKSCAHHHHHHGHGDFRNPLFAEQNNRKRSEAQHRRKQMEGGELPCNVGQQRKQLAGTSSAAEQLWHLHENNREAHAGDESPHHRGGDVLDDPSGLEQKEHKEPQRRQNRHQRHQLHGGVGFCGDAKLGQQTAHHYRRHGVHPHHKLGRGGNQAKGQNGQQGAVESVDHRQSRNLRVPHGDGNGDQCNDDPGQKIPPGMAASKLFHDVPPHFTAPESRFAENFRADFIILGDLQHVNRHSVGEN